ncbi:hypothetical protein WH47_03998 [Habropoda laboriosa]|uniref:Ribosomal protein L7Ae/L30e/S12e/Gadd45 domain-containing protein n=1 Tax=Habropoda laboriosa TaxID=597456 RepID=A0A0L7QUE8_9HYME|nr:PREDICTED: uncharacterized protein LOC108575263 [Habropoda laboriosa]KOC62240.1 hypothetical protein WH47_03998 [Habropoda laboriosa]
MTRCQSIRSYGATSITDSGNLSWPKQKEPRCPRGTITCGMLPTLQALASKECENSQGTVCLVPFDTEMDSASHLQMILLEAYCREIGIKVLRVSRERIREHLCPDTGDLSCVLISNGDPYFLDTPK